MRRIPTVIIEGRPAAFTAPGDAIGTDFEIGPAIVTLPIVVGEVHTNELISRIYFFDANLFKQAIAFHVISPGCGVSFSRYHGRTFLRKHPSPPFDTIEIFSL
jgi:hypothetical protein